jgi:hypothetical protein
MTIATKGRGLMLRPGEIDREDLENAGPSAAVELAGGQRSILERQGCTIQVVCPHARGNSPGLESDLALAVYRQRAVEPSLRRPKIAVAMLPKSVPMITVNTIQKISWATKESAGTLARRKS